MLFLKALAHLSEGSCELSAYFVPIALSMEIQGPGEKLGRADPVCPHEKNRLISGDQSEARWLGSHGGQNNG